MQCLGPAIRRLRAMFIWGVLLATGFAAGIPATAAQPAAAPSTAHPGTHAASRKATPKQAHTVSKPLWADLTPAQQQALAPLAPEWNKFGSFRKKKWLAIGNRFASMKPDEQQRMQERMRDWVKLTPEQRRRARENYARAKRLNRTQKSARWKKYQQLPEAQKKKLAADAATHKHVATIPTPSAQAANNTILPPIKSASQAPSSSTNK